MGVSVDFISRMLKPRECMVNRPEPSRYALSARLKRKGWHVAKRSRKELLLYAESRAATYLADANEAKERGDVERAESLYGKSQFWHDRMNRYLGNGDGGE